MPKLNGTLIADRLKRRLDELLRGEEVAPRDIESLLTPEQFAAFDLAKKEMKILKDQKRARNREEEIALGWKSIHEMRIEALTQALDAAQEGELAAWQKKMHDAEVRQGRVYFDELKAETAKGVDIQTAKTRANNALTRAGLKRLDGVMIGAQGLTQRDREIRAMEDAIRDKAHSELDDDEREQLELLREHEKAVIENRKRRGK